MATLQRLAQEGHEPGPVPRSGRRPAAVGAAAAARWCGPPRQRLPTRSARRIRPARSSRSRSDARRPAGASEPAAREAPPATAGGRRTTAAGSPSAARRRRHAPAPAATAGTARPRGRAAAAGGGLDDSPPQYRRAADPAPTSGPGSQAHIRAKRSAASISRDSVPFSLAAWPASETTCRSASGHARCRSQADFIGQTTS